MVVPLAVVCVGLVGLGSHLVFRSLRRIKHHDELIRRLKAEHVVLARLVD